MSQKTASSCGYFLRENVFKKNNIPELSVCVSHAQRHAWHANVVCLVEANWNAASACFDETYVGNTAYGFINSKSN